MGTLFEVVSHDYDSMLKVLHMRKPAYTFSTVQHASSRPEGSLPP